MSKISPKVHGNIEVFSKLVYLTSLVSLFLILLSLAGIGFPIFKYIFLQTGVLDDLETGILLAPYFYNPNLLEIPGFQWVISPFTNQINFFLSQIVLYFQPIEQCQTLSVIVNCNPSKFLTITGKVFLVPDLVIILWILINFFGLFAALRLLTNRKMLSFALALSYPFLFSVSRGNPDSIITILLCLILVSVRNKRFNSAYILIVLCAWIKLPLLALSFGIYLKEKSLKKFIYVNLAGLSGYIWPLFLLPDNGSPVSQLKTFSSILDR